MESSGEGAQGTERVVGYFSATLRKTWYPPTYDLYFTDRRLIFARIGDYIPPAAGVGSIISEIGQAAEKHNIKERREKYAQVTLQEIADGKDNVGAFYDDIASVLVKEKRFSTEIWFTFARKQKLEWEKAGFTLYEAQTIQSAGSFFAGFYQTN